MPVKVPYIVICN